MDTMENYINTFYLGQEEEIKEFSRSLVPDNDKDWEESMSDLLQLLIDNKSPPELIYLVLSPWDKEYNFDRLVARLIRDFLLDHMDMEELILEIQNLTEFMDVLKNLIDIRKNKNFALLCSMTELFYDRKLKIEEIRNLLSYAENYSMVFREDTSEIEDFLKKRLSVNKKAKIPHWLSVKDGENLSLLEVVSPGPGYQELLLQEENIKNQASDIFCQYDDGHFKDIKLNEEFGSALQSFLSSLSYQESSGTHNPNRVFGPANAFGDKNCISNISESGPCRMLHCLCREYDYNDDTIVEKNWFTGLCNYCMLGIRNKSHAVRFPVENGGWKGCYCSFECMKEALSYIDDKANFRLDIMKEVLLADGIMDRSKI